MVDNTRQIVTEWNFVVFFFKQWDKYGSFQVRQIDRSTVTDEQVNIWLNKYHGIQRNDLFSRQATRYSVKYYTKATCSGTLCCTIYPCCYMQWTVPRNPSQLFSNFKASAIHDFIRSVYALHSLNSIYPITAISDSFMFIVCDEKVNCESISVFVFWSLASVHLLLSDLFLFISLFWFLCLYSR